ncbi:MAG: DUF4153 domain-containing protein [Clostridia bacterium]|nr:DUF4153 domain-containing protein [Clostridia bacterium]
MTVFLASFCGLCYSVAGTLLSEALNAKRLRAGLPIAGFAIGAGMFCLCSRFSPNWDAGIGVALSAALLCGALIAKGDRPQELLGQALGCLVGCASISVLVLLALNLLVSAAVELFASGLGWETTGQLQMTALAASALLAAPFLLFALLPDGDAPKDPGSRKVISYVILPAYMLLLIVLFGYIAAILVKWEWPSGRINPYALLALGTFAALHLLLTGEENRLSRLFSRFGAWMLLPVIFAQAVAVSIRIEAYGLTQSRILGLAFTAACLIPVGAALFRRYGRLFFPVCAVLLLVLTAAPQSPLNASALARRNQESRLFGALAHAGMLDGSGGILPNENASEEDRKIIWSSAEFLYLYCDSDTFPEDSRASGFLRQLDAAEEKAGFNQQAEALFGFGDPNRDWVSRSSFAYGVSTDSEVDVEGFRHAKWLSLLMNEDNEWRDDADGDTIQIDVLLPLADFESETLTEPDILLESGRTLRIISIERDELQYAEGNGKTQYQVCAWLLTP